MHEKRVRKSLKLSILAGLLALIMAVNALAADLTYPAIENGTGSITVTMETESEDGSIQAVPGGKMAIYQVATVEKNGVSYYFLATEDFAESRAKDDIDGKTDDYLKDKWAELAIELSDYTKDNDIEYYAEKDIGDDGSVLFNNLPYGLYLVVQTSPANGYFEANPFLVSVPLYDKTSDSYIYDVDATPKTEPLDREFFELDEWIVPDENEHHGDTNPEDFWDKEEGINEIDGIELEMNTILPLIPVDILQNDSVVMTFHHYLDDGLELNSNEIKVYIGDTPIDAYCTVDLAAVNIRPLSSRIMTAAALNPMASIVQPYSEVKDCDYGCDFHVTVNLSDLYGPVISEDDLGSTPIRVFFYVDLEDDVDIQKEYTSYARYEVDVVDPGTGDMLTRLYESADWAEVKLYTFEISIYKYDTDTKAPLAGAYFGVYTDVDCQHLAERGGETLTGTSGADGYINFIGLGDGTYYIKEISAPNGYKQGDEVEKRTLNINTAPDHISTYDYGNVKSTSSSTGGGGSSGGGGGGRSSGSGSGSTAGGPGSVDVEPEGEDGIIWNLLPIPQTGQGWALMIAVCAMLMAGIGLIVAYMVRRKG